MRRVHFVGGKNHGKTTLIVELVREFGKRGLRVGTIKHTHHQHELDAPGKDSHRHRQAGAAVVGISSPSLNAVFWPAQRVEGRGDDHGELKYAAFAPMFEGCDLVLVEGDSQSKLTKLEVWRSDLGTAPLARCDASMTAVITDDATCDDLGAPRWPRSNVPALAENLLALPAMRR